MRLLTHDQTQVRQAFGGANDHQLRLMMNAYSHLYGDSTSPSGQVDLRLIGVSPCTNPTALTLVIVSVSLFVR